MEQYIQISKINDFLYCPLSLYLHSVYETFNEKTYHQTPQIVGRINHEPIESGTYSTAKKFLQGIPVYSEQYTIAGKIDIFDQATGTLIERKTKIKQLYQGHIYQMYAQYFCMKEMGYNIKKLVIHSLQDNKRYNIPLPEQEDIEDFEETLNQINNFRIENYAKHRCLKCKNSIYGLLTW